jgi:hypothetical protein
LPHNKSKKNPKGVEEMSKKTIHVQPGTTVIVDAKKRKKAKPKTGKIVYHKDGTASIVATAPGKVAGKKKAVKRAPAGVARISKIVEAVLSAKK